MNCQYKKRQTADESIPERSSILNIVREIGNAWNNCSANAKTHLFSCFSVMPIFYSVRMSVYFWSGHPCTSVTKTDGESTPRGRGRELNWNREWAWSSFLCDKYKVRYQSTVLGKGLSVHVVVTGAHLGNKHTKTHTHTLSHTHTHTLSNTHSHAHTHTHIHTLHTHSHPHTLAYTHSHTLSFTHIHTHTHSQTHTYTYTYTHSYTHTTHTFTPTHTRIHTLTHTYTHTHSHTHTHIHTHSHTPTHTHTLTYT